MIYAVISDIHGNYPAMKAVITDAKARGANAFLLLGDYIRDFPFTNEVVDAIRELPNCTAILGNGDIGVISLDNTKPDHCEYEQMLPNYITYKNLSHENLSFLKSLPESAEVMTQSGKLLHLSHSIPLINHTPRLDMFHSSDYALKMEANPFSLEDGMRAIQKTAEDYAVMITDFPGDVCLYGHNHLQFHGTIAGKILLNPGSCGLPADYDVFSPYVLIHDGSASLRIELRRAKYDLRETLDTTPYVEFWGKLTKALLISGSDLAMHLFWKYARNFLGYRYPMENKVWREVINSFVFPNSITKR